MSFESLNELERRDLARRHLDSVESWLRRLIDYQLGKGFGPDYFGSMLPDGSSIIQKGIREEVEKRGSSELACG